MPAAAAALGFSEPQAEPQRLEAAEAVLAAWPGLGAVLLGDRLEIGRAIESHAACLGHWIMLLKASAKLLLPPGSGCFAALALWRFAALLLCRFGADAHGRGGASPLRPRVKEKALLLQRSSEAGLTVPHAAEFLQTTPSAENESAIRH